MTPLVLRPEDDLEPFVRALEVGESTVLPTDTVYGLACAAHLEVACERTLGLKERDRSKPTSILVGSVASLFASVLPELGGPQAAQARRLLPGAVTVVVSNPARRFAWLCGADPTRIGVRVPLLLGPVAAAIERVGAIAATSANLAGGPDPCALDEVPDEVLSHVSVAIDGGPSPAGLPSTVVDLTGATPVVLRAGAVAEAEIRRLLLD
jgi:tRNA threonylcarbamoyl adenosine modification protein (Sua5/YciO/YrdC/YwlC family)